MSPQYHSLAEVGGSREGQPAAEDEALILEGEEDQANAVVLGHGRPERGFGDFGRVVHDSSSSSCLRGSARFGELECHVKFRAQF